VLLHYLKSNCGWFPAVCRLWNISLDGPAVVNQHTEAPLALVPLFHVVNVPMKSLSVLVTDGAKILREESLSESLRNVHLGTYYIPKLCRPSISHSLFHEFSSLWFPKKLFVTWQELKNVNDELFGKSQGRKLSWNSEWFIEGLQSYRM
jgi:hypothetical protein